MTRVRRPGFEGQAVDIGGQDDPAGWARSAMMRAREWLGSGLGSNRDTDPSSVIPCGEIFVVHPDGAGLRRLTRSATVDCLSSWGRDGHILFSSDRRDPGGQSDMWAMNADGSDPTLIAALPGDEQDPVLFAGTAP